MTDIDALHDDIVDALGELRGARQIAERNPSAENLRVVDLCEWRLDVLLGRQAAISRAEAMVKA